MNAGKARQRLADGLRDAGLRSGGVALVHTSLASLGYVYGGAETVVRGLLDALGQEGTLLMPALSYEHVRPDQPRFEVRDTPSNVGAIPEHFRTRLGTRRSLQPTHSVCGVDDGGVLGAVRHPWYAAGIILVWARALTAADLIAAAIITVYMIVGSVLEERKPVREFGAEYEAYQRRVPMLVPWKWVWARLWRPGRE